MYPSAIAFHRRVRCHENDLFPRSQCQMACVATHRLIMDASYMDRAMPEHIARSREGLMLIRSPGRFALVHSVQLHDPAFVRHCGGVVLQPASQKRPDSELRTANSVRALSCVRDLRSH